MMKTVRKRFTLKQAVELAISIHKEQLDKAGKPYIDHLLNVMNQLQSYDARMVGVLHDVVEDSDTTFEDLEKMGCPQIVISALRLVTHPPGYKGKEQEYLKAIHTITESGNQLAIDVKFADLTHNSDMSRIPNPEDRDLQRLKKYHKSMEILKPFISDYLKVLKNNKNIKIMKINNDKKLNKSFQLLYKNLYIISGSSNYVLEEIKNFKLPDKEIYDAFNTLRLTVLFDLDKEVRTLEDKMGLHPNKEQFDEYAKGAPLVNMEFIRNWLTKDFKQMQNAIQNLQDQTKKDTNIPEIVNVLCMEQGVHILNAFTNILDILDDLKRFKK